VKNKLFGSKCSNQEFSTIMIKLNLDRFVGRTEINSSIHQSANIGSDLLVLSVPEISFTSLTSNAMWKRFGERL
jgi:hypothetical protein